MSLNESSFDIHNIKETQIPKYDYAHCIVIQTAKTEVKMQVIPDIYYQKQVYGKGENSSFL